MVAFCHDRSQHGVQPYRRPRWAATGTRLPMRVHCRCTYAAAQRRGEQAMATITEIAHGLRFPEGPVAFPDGSVVLVEIERQTLSRVQPGGAVSVIATLGGGP